MTRAVRHGAPPSLAEGREACHHPGGYEPDATVRIVARCYDIQPNGGFWDEIAAFFRDEEERRNLLKELAHGGCLLVLTDLDLDEDDIALDILDDE